MTQPMMETDHAELVSHAQRGFAGTLNSADLMYRTTDGGASWTLATNIPEPRPNALCGVSIGSSQVIYGVGSYSGPARMITELDDEDYDDRWDHPRYWAPYLLMGEQPAAFPEVPASAAT